MAVASDKGGDAHAATGTLPGDRGGDEDLMSLTSDLIAPTSAFFVRFDGLDEGTARRGGDRALPLTALDPRGGLLLGTRAMVLPGLVGTADLLGEARVALGLPERSKGSAAAAGGLILRAINLKVCPEPLPGEVWPGRPERDCIPAGLVGPSGAFLVLPALLGVTASMRLALDCDDTTGGGEPSVMPKDVRGEELEASRIAFCTSRFKELKLDIGEGSSEALLRLLG